MNKLLIPLLLFCCIYQSHGQSNVYYIIDINNINEAILVHGDMGWIPGSGAANTEFPAGSGKNINFASALWLSGYDAGNNLHIAAQTYRQNGNDYWPGGLDSTDTITNTNIHNWSKIWKVNKSTIDSFILTSIHTVSTTPTSILTWPGKGNVNAIGFGTIPLTVTTDMAPFVDLNGNGIYEPLLGEYPDIKGDQALWQVFNDNGPAHSETHGRPLKVEVHLMTYGYHRGTLIDNVIYYEYSIINKSANNYHNFRMGFWDDMDLGYYFDDFIGFDSTWRMGITYNGNPDDGITVGHPLNSYGRSIPIVGITAISLPGDVPGSPTPLGTFDYYRNDTSNLGNPQVDTQYNNLMHGFDRMHEHFTNDFVGPGVPSTGIGSGSLTNYVFTGNPATAGTWSECGAGNTPGDRRFLMTTGDFNLNAGATQKIVMALVTTNPDTLGGCPNTDFTKLEIVADTAWHNYHNSATGIGNEVKAATLRVYPNPANSQLIIEYPGNVTGNEHISIYNSIGQLMNVSLTTLPQKTIANIADLPNGVYVVLFQNGQTSESKLFIKN